MQADESDIALTVPYLDPFSFREIHAIADGIYCGVHQLEESEYEKEKHYWRIGWLIGDFYDRNYR